MEATKLQKQNIEHPILFSSPMVKAILEGRKTQTRRVVKHQTLNVEGTTYLAAHFDGKVMTYTYKNPHTGQNAQMHAIKCPYGQVGHRLWVRETWLYVGEGSGCCDDCTSEALANPKNQKPSNCWFRATEPDSSIKWKPSIFMPRWASRISLLITGVRVERLQAISTEDILREGFNEALHIKFGNGPNYHDTFQAGWNSINGKRQGCDWQSNPFVWAISFKSVESK